jgi:hypothetical protein
MAPKPKIKLEINIGSGLRENVRHAARVNVTPAQIASLAPLGTESATFVCRDGILCGVYFPIAGELWNGGTDGDMVAMDLEMRAWYVSQELRYTWPAVKYCKPPTDKT